MAENSLTYHLVIAAVLVAAFFVFSVPLRAAAGYAARQLARRTKAALAAAILDSIRSPVARLTVLTGFYIALREVRKGATPADVTLNQILEYGDAILYVLVVVVIVRIIIAVFRAFISWYLDRISAEGTSSLKLTLGPLTSKTASIAVGLVAVIVVLDHFAINVGSLLVSLGVGSLAVALAAQDTLANIIAGFVILVDRPFRVGDRIELSGGQVGDVQVIGLRSTRLLNGDNNTAIIPNAELVKTRIVNYSYPLAPIRVAVTFETALGTDPAHVRQLLIDLALRQPDLLRDPPPQVSLTAIGEHSVQFTLEGQCARYDRQYVVQTALREQAYQSFLKEGIPMPMPQQLVTMKADR